MSHDKPTWLLDTSPQPERIFYAIAAVRDDPQSADKWARLGLFLADSGDQVKAEYCFERALKIEPNHAEALAGQERIATAKSLESYSRKRRQSEAGTRDIKAFSSSNIARQQGGNLFSHLFKNSLMIMVALAGLILAIQILGRINYTKLWLCAPFLVLIALSVWISSASSPSVPPPSKRIDPKAELEKIDHMSGREFERYVSNLLKRRGFAVELTPGSGDYGVDIVAEMAGTTDPNMNF